MSPGILELETKQACFSFLSISKYHDVNCGLWNSFPKSTCSLRSLISHVRRFSNPRSRENIHRLFTYSWIFTIKYLGQNLRNLRVRVRMRDLPLNVKAILLFVYESSKYSLKHKTRTRASEILYEKFLRSEILRLISSWLFLNKSLIAYLFLQVFSIQY